MICRRKLMALTLIFAMALLALPLGSVQAQTVFTEKGISQELSFNAAGALTGGTHQVRESDGGPAGSSLRDVGYPPNSVIEIEVTLTVEKGSYKVEFQNQGTTSLLLEAENGSSAEAKGLVSIDARGNLPYSVTSKQAENALMTIKVR